MVRLCKVSNPFCLTVLAAKSEDEDYATTSSKGKPMFCTLFIAGESERIKTFVGCERNSKRPIVKNRNVNTSVKGQLRCEKFLVKITHH